MNKKLTRIKCRIEIAFMADTGMTSPHGAFRWLEGEIGIGSGSVQRWFHDAASTRRNISRQSLKSIELIERLVQAQVGPHAYRGAKRRHTEQAKK